ncbi:MAG: thiol peroxidase [Bacteroidia bacterium]
MASVTLKGTPFSIKDDIPAPGIPAPDFTFVTEDLGETSLYDIDNKIKVLIGVPSLDTGICAIETIRFNKELAKYKDKDVIGIVISKDLPFAMKRFCTAEGVENIIIGSDYRYSDFINEFNTEILSGPMKGLSARAVFIVDQKNIVRYSQLVPEIAQEPDYDHTLAALDKLV